MEITYDDLIRHLQTLEPEEQVEKMDLWRHTVNRLYDAFSEKYTYCTGCGKYVERSAWIKTCEPQSNSSAKYVIRCRECGIPWAFEEELRVEDLVTDGEHIGCIRAFDEDAQTAIFEYQNQNNNTLKEIPLKKLRKV